MLFDGIRKFFRMVDSRSTNNIDILVLFEKGSVVKDVSTEKYYVLAQDLKEENELKKESDDESVVVKAYELLDCGHWIQRRLLRQNLVREFPTYIEGDEKRRALRYAMDAMGGYIRCRHISDPDTDWSHVIRLSKEYAEVCQKVDSKYKFDERKNVEDLLH